jgi:hypothetical protein
MGGKPSKGTGKDKRLAVNKKTTPKAKPPWLRKKGGK